MATKPKERDRVQKAYVLPLDLVRLIRVEAAEKGCYPNEIVERRLRDSYAGQHQVAKSS